MTDLEAAALVLRAEAKFARLGAGNNDHHLTERECMAAVQCAAALAVRLRKEAN